VSDSRFSVESSSGRLQVQFGWDGWVAVTAPPSNGASHAARRLVESRHDLTEVLLGFDLPGHEAERVADALWKRRRESPPETEPAGRPSYDGGLLVLLAALALVAGAVVLASMVGLL
jgi:hypothetical protein